MYYILICILYVFKILLVPVLKIHGCYSPKFEQLSIPVQVIQGDYHYSVLM